MACETFAVVTSGCSATCRSISCKDQSVLCEQPVLPLLEGDDLRSIALLVSLFIHRYVELHQRSERRRSTMSTVGDAQRLWSACS